MYTRMRQQHIYTWLISTAIRMAFDNNKLIILNSVINIKSRQLFQIFYSEILSQFFQRETFPQFFYVSLLSVSLLKYVVIQMIYSIILSWHFLEIAQQERCERQRYRFAHGKTDGRKQRTQQGMVPNQCH